MKLKRLKSIPEIQILYSRLKGDFEKEILTAALRNYCSIGNPIRFNNFAFVARELFTKITNRLAPINDVKLACWYVIPEGDYEVTRRQQLKYCTQGYFSDNTVPDDIEEDTKEVTKEYLKLYQKLNKYTHISENSKGANPKEAFIFLKDLVASFTSILDTIDDIKYHIEQSIEESVYDIVLDSLIFESHDALIELSSQTVVDLVNVEGCSIDKVEPNHIIYHGNGEAECSLNYGSKNDSCVVPHDVPFTFKLTAPIDNVTDIRFYERGIYLNNSSFYE